MAATFGPVFENFGRFSPIEIPARPGRTVAWRHGATWLGQIEDLVTEWSFGPEEENDLLAMLADFQGWGDDFEKSVLCCCNRRLPITRLLGEPRDDRPTVRLSR